MGFQVLRRKAGAFHPVRRLGQYPDRTFAIPELMVAANLFSETCDSPVCGPAVSVLPRRIASIERQSLSFTSADSFSAASNVLVNLSGTIRCPLSIRWSKAASQADGKTRKSGIDRRHQA